VSKPGSFLASAEDQERTGTTYPAREDFYVVAPAVVQTKARYGLDWFNGKWNQQDLF
jgi:hypothetical protein